MGLNQRRYGLKYCRRWGMLTILAMVLNLHGVSRSYCPYLKSSLGRRPHSAFEVLRFCEHWDNGFNRPRRRSPDTSMIPPLRTTPTDFALLLNYSAAAGTRLAY